MVLPATQGLAPCSSPTTAGARGAAPSRGAAGKGGREIRRPGAPRSGGGDEEGPRLLADLPGQPGPAVLHRTPLASPDGGTSGRRATGDSRPGRPNFSRKGGDGCFFRQSPPRCRESGKVCHLDGDDLAPRGLSPGVTCGAGECDRPGVGQRHGSLERGHHFVLEHTCDGHRKRLVEVA